MESRPSYRRTFIRLLGFLRPYKISLAVSVVLTILLNLLLRALS